MILIGFYDLVCLLNKLCNRGITMVTNSASSMPAVKVGRIALWTLRVVVAAAFVAAGSAKLLGAPPMVAIFNHIGVGQWFRFVTALVEISGALLIVVPRLSSLGAGLLACTMAAALIVHWTVIGGNWRPAAVLLLLNLAVLMLNRSRFAVPAVRSIAGLA